MPSLRPGGFRLFRIFGIDVSVHWLWILVAVYQINYRRNEYSSIGWVIAEYLTLFVIVLLHEFGHALACRSVGGKADHIMLWPLGGVAFVQPPPRPGATLWSIVAGPMVNVLLIPVTIGLYVMFRSMNELSLSPQTMHDLRHYLWMVGVINVVLLVFNMLPIYPLDGGQILRSLLWFVIGRAKSLTVASYIGIAGAVAGVIFALVYKDSWLVLIALFAAMQCWQGLKQARALGQLDALPQHRHVRCPSCGAHPPAVPTVRCACGQPLDPIINSQCPACGRRIDAAPCPHCGAVVPIQLWLGTGGAGAMPVSPYSPPVVGVSGAVSDNVGR